MRRDDSDITEISGPPVLTRPAADVIRVLSGMITPTRLGRIEAAARGRTLGVVPVLDGLSDPHNASAILRSAEAFGIQSLHLVPGPHGFRATRSVEKGSSRWLDIQLHRDSDACADAVLRAGYQLYMAVMDGKETPEQLADRVAGGERIAVVFGNEREGISPEMQNRATGSYRVPMLGFVESLNVSVAAATTLYTMTARAPRGSEAEVETLIARYLMHSVHDAEGVLELELGAR